MAAVTTELLERVQQLESCLRQAESLLDERAAELELARRELRRISYQVAEQHEEAKRQRESVQRLQSELDSTRLHAHGTAWRSFEQSSHFAKSTTERKCK